MRLEHTGLLKVLKRLAKGFPEMVHRLYVINTPPLIALVWRLLSPCLFSRRLGSKVELLGGQVRLPRGAHAECCAAWREWGVRERSACWVHQARVRGVAPDLPD